MLNTIPQEPNRWRRRVVEHPGLDRPTYLILPLAKYAYEDPACRRKYFTPPIPEAAPHARTSRRLQQIAAGLYRRGKAALRDVVAGSALATRELSS